MEKYGHVRANAIGFLFYDWRTSVHDEFLRTDIILTKSSTVHGCNDPIRVTQKSKWRRPALKPTTEAGAHSCAVSSRRSGVDLYLRCSPVTRT
jgi:hypothetical protein